MINKKKSRLERLERLEELKAPTIKAIKFIDDDGITYEVKGKIFKEDELKEHFKDDEVVTVVFI